MVESTQPTSHWRSEMSRQTQLTEWARDLTEDTQDMSEEGKGSPEEDP